MKIEFGAQNLYEISAILFPYELHNVIQISEKKPRKIPSNILIKVRTINNYSEKCHDTKFLLFNKVITREVELILYIT